jgi:hypothetical protein
MSNGLKNIQSHARAHARRERLESGQPLTAYDDPDGALGCLTPVDDVDVADQSYSSPETGGSTTGAHSTPGGSSGSAGSAGSHSHPTFANMHHHHQHQHPHHTQVGAAAAAGYQGYAGYATHHQQQTHHGHGYSNSVSSTGTAGGYSGVGVGQQPGSGSGSQGTSPYMGHGARLPSVGDMGIDAIINRGQGS